MNFLNNPEYTWIKVLLFVCVIGAAGFFVYNHTNSPLGGTASVAGSAAQVQSQQQIGVVVKAPTVVSTLYATNNVGIGVPTTTNPRSSLDVWGGQIDATGTDLNGTAIVSSNAGNAYFANNSLTNGISIAPNGNIKFGKQMMQINADQGGSIELGGTNTIGNTGIPYIDFHGNSATPQDFNVRIINDANNQLSFVTSSNGTAMSINRNTTTINNLAIGNGINVYTVHNITGDTCNAVSSDGKTIAQYFGTYALPPYSMTPWKYCISVSDNVVSVIKAGDLLSGFTIGGVAGAVVGAVIGGDNVKYTATLIPNDFVGHLVP